MTSDDSKNNNNNNNAADEAVSADVLPEAEQKVIWNEYLSRTSPEQCQLFLNLYWDGLEAEKEDIFAVYQHYSLREAMVPTVAFSPFNLILENLSKDKHTKVIAAMDAFGDRSSMAKRFLELGFKMNNSKITLLEALLFVYGKTVAEVVSRAPTACSLKLRVAQKGYKAVEDGQQARVDLIAKLKADIEDGTIKPMKVAGIRLKVRQMESELRADGVQMKRDLKTAKKVITTAEGELEVETRDGTDASNYFKDKNTEKKSYR